MSNDNTEPVRRRSHRVANAAEQAAADKRMARTSGATNGGARSGAHSAVIPPIPPSAARSRTQQATDRTAGAAQPVPATPTTTGLPGEPAGLGRSNDDADTAPIVDTGVADVTYAQAVVVGADPGAVEVLDAKLLAHLDEVLADLSPTSLPEPDPQASAAPSGAEQPTAAPGAEVPALTENAEPTTLWSRVLADPGFAAEHVAQDAVRRLGPRAQAWVDRTRHRYPDARPDALALLAVAEHARSARRRALNGAFPGRLAPVVGAGIDLGVLTRTHASLVLTIGAVYGAEPNSPDRAADLLAVLRVPRLTQSGPAAARNLGRLVASVAIRRMAGQIVPFGTTAASIVHSGGSMEAIGRRAINRFRTTAPR
jgi:hypothetical protein